MSDPRENPNRRILGSPPQGAGPAPPPSGFKDLHRVPQIQNTYGEREVGITHPDNESFVRLMDNGDIEISTKPGLAIIMHGSNKGVSIIADSIRFITKEHGLRWNDLTFNPQSTAYTEPTFMPVEDNDVDYLYKGIEGFMLTPEDNNG